MAEAPEFKVLLETLKSLREEVRELRSEVESLKRGTETPAPEPLPAKPPSRPGLKIVFPKASPSKPLARTLYDALGGAQGAGGLSYEEFIGQKLLHYVGILCLALGVAFFLIWRAAHTGPAGKIFTASLSGGTLLLVGLYLKSKPVYEKISNAVVGGGWTVLCLTAYAAYHFEASKIIDSPVVGVALLGVVAFSMICHGLVLESRAFRLYSFGLTYFVFLISHQTVPSFEIFLFLLAGSAFLAVQFGEADILVVSVIGFYLNYLPVYWEILTLPRASRDVMRFAQCMAWLTLGYLIPAGLPWFTQAREKLFKPGGEKTLDAAMCLNAVVFVALAYTMTRTFFDSVHFLRAAALSLLLSGVGLSYLRLIPREMAVTSVQAVLGLAALAAGIFDMPSPLWKMFAWVAVSCLWVWIGLMVNHSAWRVSGLVMSLLTFGFYLNVARVSEAYRQAGAAALFLFSALSYLFSRFYRIWLQGKLKEWETPVMEYWLYVGSSSLILALWAVLEPAPFAVALLAVALLGEFAAAYFGRVHLWVQAALVEIGAAAYTFFIDYGPNLPVAGILTPRLLVSSCVAAGLAYLYYGDPTPREFTSRFKRWSQAEQRTVLSWALAAVAAFAIYAEFGPRVRLPLWSLGAAFLYYLGRRRGELHLSSQAILVAGLTGVEGVWSYLLYPRQLLGEPTGIETAIYWGSAGLLLLNLFMAKDEKSFPAPAPLDRQAGGYFSWLSLGLMAFYLAKELESYNLTLAWSMEGMVFLVGGIGLDYKELRYPALALLGMCVAKALLLDTAGLPLPYRVASFLVLGAVLLLGSMMYMRAGSREKSGS